MSKLQIFPSLMAADLLNLESVITTLEPYCDGFHIDIMDNHFVPNLTWGAMVTNALAGIATKPFLVHLMIDHPETMIPKLKLPPNSVISVHVEGNKKIKECFALIKKAGYIPSVAIKPGTPLQTIFPFLDDGLPHVLLMSVEPGFSGQSFLPCSIDRLKQLVLYRTKHQKDFVICMDGGINKGNIGKLHALGAQQFAVASSIFSAVDSVEALEQLYQAGTTVRPDRTK